VLQLIDKVSRGGNFLLDIGPDAHGKIPPNIQERLLGIGNWMKINGEAIYNTVEWQRPSQWSDGNRNYKPKNKSGDLLLKLTVDPDPGYAVKEVFFTYNEKENNLYAILPRYPENKKIRLKDISLPAGTAINFLSTGTSLSWKQVGSDVEVEMPEYNPNTIKAPYAFVLKINNYGRFTAKPVVQVDYNPKNLKPTLQIDAQQGARVYYTLDGSEPSQSATQYSAPIKLSGTATVKAVAYRENALPSLVAEGQVGSYSWQKSTPLRSPAKGLHYRYYELQPKSVRDMEGLTPAKSGVAPLINAGITSRKEYCGLRFDGYFKAEEDALYTFYLTSDDGSVLWIDGKQLIDNDGMHGNEEKSASVALRKGYHALKVDYMQYNGAKALRLSYSKPGAEKEAVPEGLLFH
ncbi:MAG TPA: PA14 domain-containing protein, partial [Chitinophagaceae bacterium]|nr:PA14 domain-containing protein [Chitinophagaceae bacterium]